MGQLLRTLAVVAAVAAGASLLLAFDAPAQAADGSKTAPAKGPGPGSAAPGAKAKAAEDSPAAIAQRMVDAGVAAYQAGRTDQAIRAFDAAISGGLSNQQMARALYYRGLTYRKKDKPALAIADLTGAIWLKDGLSVAEKQEAMSNRVAAYSDAGVGDVPEVAQPGGIAGGSFGAAGWQTAMSGSPPAAAAPSASQSSASPASAPVSAPQSAVYYAPSRPPPPPEPSSSSSSSSGVGGFFSSITNMFGGGSSSSSSGEVTTASIAPPVAANWSQTTEIATAPPPPAAPPPAAAPPAAPPPAAAQPAPAPPPVQQAAAAPTPPPAAPQPFATQTQVTAVAPPIVAQPPASETPTGKYHVQVAAVRSRSEAYALSVRLLSQHGSELGSRKPEVDQTVIGSMGTFYRVQVGPYASAKESQQLCGSLRASGFDCLVTTD